MVRVFSYLILFISSIALCGCAQQIGTGFTNIEGSGQQTIEIDPTITAEQYVQGLRQAKGLLLDYPFLTASEQSVTDLAGYQAKIRAYLENPESTRRIISLYKQLFQLEGAETITNFMGVPNLVVDNEEPSSLVGYLFQNELDFREVLTATYCISSFDSGLTQKMDCLSQGRRLKNDTNMGADRFVTYSVPMEMRAGALSTQAFLKRFSGALNFRRANAAHEYFLCSNYPDPEETEGWTEQNGLLHPFYFTPEQGDQDCQSCHKGLNKARGFFTGVGPLGEIQMGQQAARADTGALINVDARTINDVEAAVINLPDYETLYGRLRTDPFESVLSTYQGSAVSLHNVNPGRLNNPSYPKLSDYGRILSQSERFGVCTAQRFYNFAMGIGQNINNKLPTRLVEPLTQNLETNNYNLKELLLEILSSTDFLNR